MVRYGSGNTRTVFNFSIRRFFFLMIDIGLFQLSDVPDTSSQILIQRIKHSLSQGVERSRLVSRVSITDELFIIKLCPYFQFFLSLSSSDFPRKRDVNILFIGEGFT